MKFNTSYFLTLVVFLSYALIGQAQVPENNLPINAIPLYCGQTISGTSINSTQTEDLEDCVILSTSIADAKGVWYSLVGNGDLVSVSTCNQADFDTMIGVYAGSIGDFECVGGNDDGDGCSNFTSSYEFYAVSDVNYYIKVCGWGYSTGNFDLTLNCVGGCMPPYENVKATYVDETTSLLSWNIAYEESEWEIEWGDSDFVLGEGATIITSDTSVTVTDLEPFNSYKYYIRSLCEDDEMSDWYGPVSWMQVEGYIEMQQTEFTLCGSSLFTDSGGVDHNYNSDEEFVLFCFPTTEGAKLQVEFLSFDCGDISDDMDFLEIFDGVDDGYPLIVSSTEVGDEGMLATFMATNEEGALTFYFASNSSVNYSGWTALLSCSEATSTDEIAYRSVQVFPNPTDNFLKINATSLIERITLFNSVGAKVLQREPATSFFRTDISHLEAGYYAIKIVTNDKTITSSFIKK